MRLVCVQCRARDETGAAFRESTGLGRSFECPNGVAWDVPRRPGRWRGLGDLLTDFLAFVGLHGWWRRKTGGACGCAGRADALNRAVPFKSE